MKKHTRNLISLIIILVSVYFSIYYLSKHRYLVTQLKHIPKVVIFEVFILYTVMFGVLLLVFSASLRVCATKIKLKDNILLNSYSLIINFFVPGQSGPVLRGYFLNKQYKLKVRYYIAVTLLYYLFYGILGLIFVALGSIPIWQTLLLVIILIFGAVLSVSLYLKYTNIDRKKIVLNYNTLGYLALITLVQACVQATIYFVELHSVNKSISINQVITYTGVANLALFVGLTPAAIGIRETFLVLTRRLHHISGNNILLANIIDRSVLVLFLAVVFILTIVLHAKGRILADSDVVKKADIQQ